MNKTIKQNCLPTPGVGVNARLLTKPFTGIGQYTRNLFKNISDQNEYVLIVPEEVPGWVKKDFPKNVRIHVLSERKRGTAGMRKTWWEQIQVPEFLLKERFDVAFFTYPANPWTADFYKKGIKTIVTVHDCIPWMDRDYRKGFLSKMYHSQTKKAVKKADLVLTVSESSKADLVKACEVDAKKVQVIYNDASDEYKRSSKNGVGILKKYGLNKGKFFLYVGGYDKRKNVKELVDSFSKFAKEESNISLVLAGGKLHKDKLYESFDLKGERIIRTGFLEEKDLHALYCNALSFVHFSLAEGFNIPILEAANSGCPLILSDIPVHREVAGVSAIYIDLEMKDAHKKFKKLLDKKIRDQYSKKALSLAKKYSWDSSAKLFQKLLKQIND